MARCFWAAVFSKRYSIDREWIRLRKATRLSSPKSYGATGSELTRRTEKQPQMHADKDRIAAASVETYLGSSAVGFMVLSSRPFAVRVGLWSCAAKACSVIFPSETFAASPAFSWILIRRLPASLVEMRYGTPLFWTQ